MSRAAVAERTHQVQFYDDESFLAERVAAFLRTSLSAQGCAIAIGRPLHLAAIEHELRGAVDVDALQTAGTLLLLDAEIVLAALMREGMPDEQLFETHVASVVRKLCAQAGSLHVYGEMVDVLWAQGRYDAVVQLETLWGKLLAIEPFSLLCGYRLSRFDNHSLGFDNVCRLHDGAASQHVLGQHADADVSRSLVQLEQRARALEVEIQRRTKLENRMLGLLEFTGQLTAAHSRDDVARLAVESGMKAVEAAAAALWTVCPDGTHLELCAATSGQIAEKFARISLGQDLPIAIAVREARPIFLGSLAQFEREFPPAFAHTKDDLKPSQVAYALLPVAGDGKPLGGVMFVYDRERAFSGPERTFKEIVARHCGLALERVELHEKEHRARAESELLYALTSEVAVAEDLASVYDIALTSVKHGTRSDRTAILLFDDDDVMRFKAWRGLSDTYRAAVEGHSPWKRDIRPAPIAVADTETDEAWATYRPVFRAEGIRSLAFIPLIYRKKLIGKFMLYRNEQRAFTSRELQLATTVAFHIGEALARKNDEAALVRAFAEEKEAHAIAEEATRAREEIISVVSHDLRNPLGAILIGASTLLQVDGDPGRRISGIASRIHRQAERMARQIEDLVDFAGIQAGKLAIERVDHMPTEIILAASDMFAPLAHERGLILETKVQPDLPAVCCDSERALQVMSNLVSNAFKVTPKGGHVKIGVEARATDIVFYVNDSGPGIASTELPKLFERYWRGKTSQYRGAGLGLSIARGIVDAHGGKIWAESTVGVGSTFFFSLSAGN